MAETVDYTGRWALVTGASSGIGAALAQALAARGASIVLVARRAERLAALARDLETRGVETIVLAADLSRPDAVRSIMDDLGSRGVAVDILVNNAGFGMPGPYTDYSWQENEDYLQLMVTAVARLTYLVLPGMEARGWGRVLNVASVSGLVPPAEGQTLYGPVKAFMMFLTQSLAAATHGKGIKLTALCPGVTETEFFDVTGQDNLPARLPRFMVLSADCVAAEGLRSLERGKTVHVSGWPYRIIVLFSRLLPLSWGEAIARRQSAMIKRR